MVSVVSPEDAPAPMTPALAPAPMTLAPAPVVIHTRTNPTGLVGIRAGSHSIRTGLVGFLVLVDQKQKPLLATSKEGLVSLQGSIISV